MTRQEAYNYALTIMPDHPYSAADFAEVLLVGMKMGKAEVFKKLEGYFLSKDEDFLLDSRVSDVLWLLHELKNKSE